MTPRDKTIGIPGALPLIGGGGQKPNVDAVLQKLMQNIHQLNQDYQSFVGVINELSTRVALLESRTSAVETKQTAFPGKVEVVIKKGA